ncbi:MAG: lysophospholipid acyltransferase family protein [Phycisphaerales bacterium]
MTEFKYQPAGDAQLGELGRLSSTRREPGLISATVRQVSASLATAYLRAYHRLEIRGREHIPPEPPLVLVANHASHLDALVLAAALPRALRARVFPLAAGDTFFTGPVLAGLAALVLNALPVWRKRAGPHALADLRERLLASGFILFPEGTRTRTGEPGKFKPGVGMLVAGTGVPVVPCWIEGAFGALPAGARLPRMRKLTLRLGAARRFEAVGNDRAGWERIAAELEEAVRALREDETKGSTPRQGSHRR